MDPALLWLWHRASGCSSNSTPSLGTPIYWGWGPKKKKKKTLDLWYTSRG